MRFVFTILILVLFSFNAIAQKNKRPNYDLLWRISGNGLTKPSYLFGTMHLQDNRAFNFNDSVLTKLIQCDAFAMEIHPDSVTRSVAAILLDQSNGEAIERQMSPKEFRHYDSLMKKATGLSLKKFKTIKQAKYFVEQRTAKKDKNTFLDAWLYNIAHENDKIIVGLEDFRTQLALFQSHDSSEMKQLKRYLNTAAGGAHSNDPLQSLFEVYYDGNVDAIYRFSESGVSEDRFKKLVVDRNADMTQNIVREIHQHSMFIAVGAAHLGGAPGIVNLLREKGYVLTTVSAPFSGTASKYKHVTPESGDKWFVFTSEEGRYSLEMPAAPVPVKLKELPVTFQTYVDIGNMSVYMAAHFPVLTAVNSQSSSKMLDEITKNISKANKVGNSRKIVIDGFEGREIETTINDVFFKIRVLIRQSNAYMIMVGPTKEAANSPEGKRFLSSLKTTAPGTSDLASFVEKTGAFTVDMPGTVRSQVVTPREPTSGETYKVNMFMSSNNNTGSTYIVRYNDFPVGYVAPNDSAYVHGIMQAVCQAMKGVDLSSNVVDFHGYPSTHFTFSTPDHLIKAECMLTIRGERFYMLMNTRAAGVDEEGTKAFFSSFRFLPCESPSLKKVSFPDGFSLLVPDTFEADSAVMHEGDVRKYAFADRFSGAMFIIQNESFTKYSERESPDAFFKSLCEHYSDYGTLMKDSAIEGNLPAHQYVYQSEKRNATVIIRSVISGKSLVSLWAYFAPEGGDLTDKIFNSFTVTSTSEWDLFADKSDLILHDITSTDSTARSDALAALGTYDFKPSQLPKIYHALQKKYDDDAQEWDGARSRLLRALTTVNDAGTQRFIEDLYPTLPDTTSLRDQALSVLSSIKTGQSVKRVAEIIATDSSGHKFSSYSMVYPLTDSLALLNDVSIKLLKSFSKFRESGGLLRAIKMALDSSVFAPDVKREIVSLVTDIAARIVDTHLTQDADGYYDMIGTKYILADLLMDVPFTAQIDAIIRKLATENDEDIKFICLQLLMKNTVDVSQQLIDSLTFRPSMRLALYEELRKYNKQQRMEKKYTTLQMLAQSEVYEYLTDEDLSPDKIEFLKEMKVVVNGEKKKILVFTYGWEESEVKYIAIAGSYPLKYKGFARGDVTTSLFEEWESEKELNKKISQYLAEQNIKLAN